jgi:hypothetical protein
MNVMTCEVMDEIAVAEDSFRMAPVNTVMNVPNFLTS